MFGILTLLTAPWLGSLYKAVIGAYPTVDKEGSLLFFEHGVHHLWFTNSAMDLQDTGLPLIGIHIGHLLPTEILSWFVPTFVAFNIQSVLHLFANILAFLFLADSYSSLQSKEWEKWIVAIVIGAQLHVFRDIHWYTIEKSALFPIFIFWGVLKRQRTLSPIWLPFVYFLAGLYNFYWAILCPLLVITEVPTHIQPSIALKKTSKALVGCLIVGLLLGFGQMSLQVEQYQFATTEAFSKRAALDVFSLSSLDWNRMGLWRPLNPIVVLLGGWSLLKIYRTADRAVENGPKTRQMVLGLMLCGALSVLLSMGPMLTDSLPNPLYQLFSMLPGMWRFAKPEIFMLIGYTILGVGMLYKEWPRWVWGITVALYLLGLYTSPAFPYLTIFIDSSLQY